MDYEMDNYNCTLETKSPVIISAGSEYQYGPQEYVFYKGKLKKSGRKIDLIKRIDITKYYKSLDEDKKEKLLSNLLDPDFNLEEYSKSNINIKKYNYYSSVSQCKKRPDKEIMEHIKTMNKLYVPGSSLKGVLTTAILYKNITSNDVKNSIGKKNRLDRYEYNNILRNYFSSKGGNSAQRNIMRFIRISDTTTKSKPSIYDIQSIQVKPDHTYEYYKRGNNVVTTYYETIEQKSKLNCNITIKKNKKILNQLNLNKKEKILDIEYIKDVLYNFSMDYIEYEQDFIDTYNIDFLKDYYRELAKENTRDSPLIRVGLGSGFMQTTINMKTKKEDPEVYEKVRNVAKGKSYNYEFPKSRKITAKGKPLGWIKLTFDKKG